MKLKSVVLTAALLAAGLNSAAFADDKVLRLLTWSDYVPADVKAQFEKETGYKVEVTLSNNEEMISKLRATGGAGFDLAQPSQDRITGPQQEHGIYKPMDLSKIKSDLFSGKAPSVMAYGYCGVFSIRIANPHSASILIKSGVEAAF